SAIEQGDAHAAEQLLPLVYEELRKLAAAKMAQEQTGQTLEATALVHEAYLRLVGGDAPQPWNSRGHLYAAAEEAMRRILIDNARRKKSVKGGGQWTRVGLDQADAKAGAKAGARAVAPPEELLALDEALEQLQQRDPVAGKLVKLRYYAGLSMEQ